MITLQAPHSFAPQPKCGLVTPSRPRRTVSRDVSASALTLVSKPLRRKRTVGIDKRLDEGLNYCGLSAIVFTTSAHLTISPRRNLSNSSGVIDIGTAP